MSMGSVSWAHCWCGWRRQATFWAGSRVGSLVHVVLFHRCEMGKCYGELHLGSRKMLRSGTYSRVRVPLRKPWEAFVWGCEGEAQVAMETPVCWGYWNYGVSPQKSYRWGVTECGQHRLRRQDPKPNEKKRVSWVQHSWNINSVKMCDICLCCAILF